MFHQIITFTSLQVGTSYWTRRIRRCMPLLAYVGYGGLVALPIGCLDEHTWMNGTKSATAEATGGVGHTTIRPKWLTV